MKKEKEKPLFRTFYTEFNKFFAIGYFTMFAFFIPMSVFIIIIWYLNRGVIQIFTLMIISLITIVLLLRFILNEIVWNEFYPDRIVTRALLKKEVNIVYLKNIKCIVSFYHIPKLINRRNLFFFPTYILCDSRPLSIGKMTAYAHEVVTYVFKSQKNEARLNPMTCVKTINNRKINDYLIRYCPTVEIMSYYDYCKKNNFRLDVKEYHLFRRHE